MTTLGNWTAEERLPSRRRQGTGEALVSCHAQLSLGARVVSGHSPDQTPRDAKTQDEKTNAPCPSKSSKYYPARAAGSD